jgi:hypothetical protein
MKHRKYPLDHKTRYGQHGDAVPCASYRQPCGENRLQAWGLRVRVRVMEMDGVRLLVTERVAVTVAVSDRVVDRVSDGVRLEDRVRDIVPEADLVRVVVRLLVRVSLGVRDDDFVELCVTVADCVRDWDFVNDVDLVYDRVRDGDLVLVGVAGGETSISQYSEQPS